MGISKNKGTPKWMVYNGKPSQNGWFGGTTIFENTHITQTKWSFRSSSACCDVFTTSIGVAITCDRLEHRPPATKNPTGPSSPSSRAGLGKVGTSNGGSACSVRVDGKRGVFRTGPRSPRFDGTRGRRWGGAKARCKEANRTLRLEKKPRGWWNSWNKTIWKKKTGTEACKIIQMSRHI